MLLSFWKEEKIVGFGIQLKKILKQKGITIKELSEMTGISINTLQSITKRDTKIPEQSIIDKISSALQIEEDELLTLDILTEDLRSSIESMRFEENKHRERLFVICKYLNSIALLQLTRDAIDMLENEDYRSIVNHMPEQ